MIGYNPSHLNKNETLLEAFHRVEAYLIEHPLYQLYQTTDNYVVNKFDYSLGNIVLPDYGEVSAGDVVLFNNVYYAVVLSVDKVKQTFNIDEGIDFRGPQGPQGPKGEPGTNPNLLINPNFAINQRGQASYTGEVYGVDRWKGVDGNVIAMQVAKGIQVKGTVAYNTYIKQVIETNLAGKTVTASCKLSAINSGEGGRLAVYYSTDGTSWAILDGMTITATGISKLTVTVPSNAVYASVDIGVRPNGDVVFEWAKLEIGSVATEFSPPSIAEELQKCYRYYKKIMNLQSASYSAFGIAYGDGSGARMIVENTFRVNPTITTAGAFSIVANGEYKTVSAMATQSFNSTNIVVKFTLNSAVADGLCGYLLSNNSPNAYIAFDAEL